jgi:hypothetical protein
LFLFASLASMNRPVARLEWCDRSHFGANAIFLRFDALDELPIKPRPAPASSVNVGISALKRLENQAYQVQDVGIGISTDQLPTAFEMFAQVAPTIERSEGGLGIGLAVAKALVEMHGGRIEAASAGLGKGSTFRVVVPRGNVLPAAIVSAKACFEPARATQEPIVIADDNLDAAQSLAARLELD